MTEEQQKYEIESLEDKIQTREPGQELAPVAVAPIYQMPDLPKGDEASFMMIIQGAVMNPGLDPKVVKELYECQTKAQDRERGVAFESAMAKFAGLKGVIHNNKKGHLSPYADFPQMVNVITPWIKKCGLSFIHTQDVPIMENGKLGVIMVFCRISHKDGHKGESIPYPAIPNLKLENTLSPSQLIQTAITYAKRQTLAMALGLSTGEDASSDPDSTPQGRPEPQAKGEGNKLSDFQVKKVLGVGEQRGKSRADVEAHFKVSIEHIPKSRMNEVMEWING